MSNASVTPQMRTYAWNVHFLTTSAGIRFAGLFRLDGFDITYRDVLNEMDLCFHTPYDTSQDDGQTSRQNPDEDNWKNAAFAFIDYQYLPPGEAPAPPTTIMITDLDQPVLLPPPALPTSTGKPPVVRLCVIRHYSCSCNLPNTAPLAAHIDDGCAEHIPLPPRRRDPRYLPPPESNNSESGQLPANEEESLVNMVTPPDMDIAPNSARQTIANFSSSLAMFAGQCAVSGKGQTWCRNLLFGPALQACHIVPQQHYHVYPDPLDPRSKNGFELSPQHLRKAWERTWSPSNGILLLSHLRELFDSRLFSIHPDTLQIRAFVPYDVICDYHGRTATLPVEVDRNALRHHYEMCCIENMLSDMEGPLTTPSMPSLVNTGTAFSFTSASIGTPEQMHSDDDNQSTRSPSGEPTQMARPANDSSTADVDGEEDERSGSDTPGEASFERGQKRRRLSYGRTPSPPSDCRVAN